MPIELDLPFPPTVNTYYRSIRMGQSCRVILSKRGRLYKDEVAALISNIQDDKESRLDSMPFLESDRLSINIKLYAPNKRKYDIDNRIKALLDALAFAGVFPDDEAVDEITVTRQEIIKGGKVIVEIEVIKDEKDGS